MPDKAQLTLTDDQHCPHCGQDKPREQAPTELPTIGKPGDTNYGVYSTSRDVYELDAEGYPTARHDSEPSSILGVTLGDLRRAKNEREGDEFSDTRAQQEKQHAQEPA